MTVNRFQWGRLTWRMRDGASLYLSVCVAATCIPEFCRVIALKKEISRKQNSMTLCAFYFIAERD
jgi:hypothetical protein